jgi:hypothetical protein
MSIAWSHHALACTMNALCRSPLCCASLLVGGNSAVVTECFEKAGVILEKYVCVLNGDFK